MKIDLSKEQGTLVPLYFYRRPLGWPEEERPAAPDRRQTDALNSLMKSRAQDTKRITLRQICRRKGNRDMTRKGQ